MKMRKIAFLALTLFTVLATAQESSLNGKVTDGFGNPIKDVNIFVLGTSKGTTTDVDGRYTLNTVSSKQHFIKASHLGYAESTKKMTLYQGNNTLDFVLEMAQNQLQEVIVSAANNRLENIQTTAASISAVSFKEIQQLQVTQLSEINSIAPNFKAYDDGGNGAFTMISSRGISTYDTKPVVGVYVDDVPYFNGFSLPIALQDVDQIEILRGPQGTLYGRNSLAGVIKINTKKPTNSVSGYLRAGFGNLDAKELTFAFNAPLVKDKLFLRASTNITDRDGYVDNLFNNKKLQNRSIADANIKLKYLASDKLRMGFLYNVQRRESDAYVFVLSAPQQSLTDILKSAPFEANFDVDVFRKGVNQNMALDIAYDFKDFGLHSITAYQKTNETGLDEFDYSPADIQAGSSDASNNNFSQEFRLVSSMDSRLDWVAGAFGYHNTFDMVRNYFIGVDIGLLNPNLAPLAPFTRVDDTKTIRQGMALYGQASYALTDHWSLTGGLRFDYEESTVSVDRTYNTDAFPDATYDQTADFDAFSPKLTLSYQANDQLFLFAGIARGFRPGGINEFIADRDKAIYDNETSTNFELGVKTTSWNNKLKLNLTGFYTQYKDQQFNTLIDLSNFMLGNANIGESRIFGLELEAKAQLLPSLNLGLNLGYLNTEITQYTELLPNPADGTLVEFDYSGKTLPVSPEFNGNINLNFIQPLSKSVSLESSLDYNYQSDIYFDMPNNMLQEAYGILNGRLGLTSKNVDLFVWAKNLTDKTYFSYGYGVGGFQASTFALPRTYGANLTLKF